MTRSEDNLILIPGKAVGSATPVGIPVCSWRTRKTEGLSKRAVPCTEKAILTKDVNTEVEKVAVCHGLGNTVIATLMLRELGKYGAYRSFWGWSFQSYRAANAFSGDALWLHQPGKGPPKWTISPLAAEWRYV